MQPSIDRWVKATDILLWSACFQMERTISVWSKPNIRDQLWRWSTFHLTKLLSPVPLFCILLTRTITKRAVAWVGSVQPECIVPLWNFRNVEWKAPMVSEYKGRNLKATVLYAPSTPSCICLKLEMRFFSPVWPAVRTYLVKMVTKNASFQKLTPFTGFSFTYWRSKTEVVDYDDVIHHILLQ